MANKKHQNGAEEQTQETFFTKYKKQLLIGVAAVVVIIVGLVIWLSCSSSTREDRKEEVALYPSENYMMQGQYDQALAGDGQACIGLEQEIKEYGSSKSGNLAKLYAGIAYYNQGKYAEAIKMLEDYSKVGDNVVDPAAMAALGNCYACNKEYDKAVAKLTEAADKADNATLSPMYLIQAGELYELALNNKDEALKCYQKAKDNYKTSYQVQSGEIDKYIERASVK